MRILYIDDHLPFRMVVQRKFLPGHDVLGAGTLADARKLLAEGTFDCVLVDYALPDGKGIDIIGEAQAAGSKVIAVSNIAEQNAEMVAAGAIGAIGKGEFGHLADKLDKILGTG